MMTSLRTCARSAWTTRMRWTVRPWCHVPIWKRCSARFCRGSQVLSVGSRARRCRCSQSSRRNAAGNPHPTTTARHRRHCHPADFWQSCHAQQQGWHGGGCTVPGDGQAGDCVCAAGRRRAPEDAQADEPPHLKSRVFDITLRFLHGISAAPSPKKILLTQSKKVVQ